ncbi:hypothetical protein IQ266_17915 [filamentous cyanobacterium LEGE 11480]|uniref:Uncharacterized protein n=1 Tax=Romeriopsis navalis LEGE 11480 TaxID=2777977 RepID=A0A928VPV2_9CYAN|nr:hypothetical protein [Romeriopsis navalis]MBE9031613.1 hypothetical protein [Romeriopsis navalis LEGE 11480]
MFWKKKEADPADDMTAITNLSKSQRQDWESQHEDENGNEKPDGPTLQDWAKQNNVKLNQERN